MLMLTRSSGRRIHAAGVVQEGKGKESTSHDHGLVDIEGTLM